MITVLDASEATELATLNGSDEIHIVCPCRFFVGYCGVYDESEIQAAEIDGSECPSCYEVFIFRDGRCPNCNCTNDEWCKLCERGVKRYERRFGG